MENNAQADDITREAAINDAFVRVAGTLVESYDVVELLSTLVNTCTQLLDVQSGGIVLADITGSLELVASTSEEVEVVEIMTIAAGAGPCIESYETGTVTSVPDIEVNARAWPRFRETALEQGFRAAHATPLRLHGSTIGAMNLLRTTPGALSERDARLAQALTDVATVGIIHEHAFRQPEIVAAQLHLALDTRILVEQAKGVLAQVRNFTMTEAFTALRGYARDEGITLRAAAQDVINRTSNIESVSPQTAR
ncbi:GAF and ANTAR domain-containing protein [Cryobacterium sp. N22]|uniref:GAF and ANTAR domain-containing protein n=1 Tax=Cryobacterium sp. N22 TaxID=2048290 RepID=UPI000CE35EC2|nr:GAF and ANTAR domain-containing protein [Cryobacterium sp. N22]